MKIKGSVIVNKIGEEGMIFDKETGHFFSLNEVAMRVIEIIKENEKDDLGEIISILLNEYEINKSELLEDVTCLIDDMKEEGILC